MAKQTRTDQTPYKERFEAEAGRAGAAKARAGLLTRLAANPSRELLLGELEGAQTLLDQGLSTEAEFCLTSLIKAAGHDKQLMARARCWLSIALEQQGRYLESLAAIKMYEQPEARVRLEADAARSVRIQLGLAYNYTGDFPKAIAILNAVLRETEDGDDAERGKIYVALARVYRNIDEFPISRDFAQKAMECYRHTGDWRGLTESYLSIAVTDTLEGDYESSLANYEQALKLSGDHPAAYLLSKIYYNLAGTYWFLRRPHEGIRYLEKAIDLYERAELKANAAAGYNNLGSNLILTGDWTRAQEALERALILGREVNGLSGPVLMTLDALGELHMLRGDLDEARRFLEEARAHALDKGNKWYAGQARRTLSRCYLASGEVEHALVEGEEALLLAEKIGDQRAIYESRLLLAEARLRRGDLESCEAELKRVTDKSVDSIAGLVISGEAQRLSGLLAFERGDALMAVHHFGRSATIFEMLGDRYKTALANYELGRAYAAAEPERAAETLAQAARIFRELGARLNLRQAESELLALADKAQTDLGRRPSLTQLSTLRLAEAVASRELLLRELGAVLYQETGARAVLVFEQGEEGPRAVSAHGATGDAERLAHELYEAQTDRQRDHFASEHDATVIELRVAGRVPATLLISPREATKLADGSPIDPLLRVAEMGLELCASREAVRSRGVGLAHRATIDQSLMQGFIHSSPAMGRLVEEMHKIRSSDVTVLITGESGTGKELVARAVHTLSARREKAFVPFNCTAIPKELSEGYLFGYRRGAFTGAVTDSPGVIRTAKGGTLFLDEGGDLPLDVQPKLLRFLQEGEIQPLGEQRPITVDVRVIAATNSDLEKMVEEGRFREDLYYRLNVIRLRVPPLRERRSEIPNIVNYYVRHYAEKFGRRNIEITPQAVDLLMVCDWPGNVRQLCNELQRVVARAEDYALITPDQLSPELQRTFEQARTPMTGPWVTTTPSVLAHGLSLPTAVEELERRMITEALGKHGGNISRAARELGLTRRGLQLKLGRYELRAGDCVKGIN